jgi:GntR family transcriptional regulator, transcriptional repressor for pyruvate dehydrogenase complex
MTTSLLAPSTLDQTVQEVQAIIVDRLSPGERLPSETELAETIGVSRLTVREAVKVLEGRGLLEVARGRRAVVRPMESSVVADYLAVGLRRDPRGLLELTAIRRALEVLSVGEAARSASDAALQAVAAAFDRMVAAAEAAGEDPSGDRLDDYHRCDLDFHSAIALASGNRMLELLLGSLTSCLHESFAVSTRGSFARGGTLADDLLAHGAVAAAVRERRAGAAESGMTRLLDRAERDLRLALRTDPAAGRIG